PRSTSTITVQSSGNIANPAVIATGGFAFAGAKGILAPAQTLATFTDPGGPENTNVYVVTVDWGDGGPTSTATVTNNNGVYTVTDRHNYAATGPFTITVTIAHTQNTVAAPNTVVTSNATILLPPVTMTGSFTFIAAEGTLSSSQTVAKFTDPGGAGAPGVYTALIDWGDGRTSAGVISVNAGVFSVTGQHNYNAEGEFNISVTISHATAPNATATSTADVVHPPLIVTGGSIFDAVEGISAVDLPVATFIDPVQASEAISTFSASINWGDGTSSAANITVDTATRIFTVRGTHTYGEEG